MDKSMPATAEDRALLGRMVKWIRVLHLKTASARKEANLLIGADVLYRAAVATIPGFLAMRVEPGFVVLGLSERPTASQLRAMGRRNSAQSESLRRFRKKHKRHPGRHYLLESASPSYYHAHYADHPVSDGTILWRRRA